MKCRECDSCKFGLFVLKPYEYVCVGAEEPFIIGDIDEECTKHKHKRLTSREDAIKYINGQLKNGYIDLGLHDELELKIVKEAMDLLVAIDKFNGIGCTSFRLTADELKKLGID